RAGSRAAREEFLGAQLRGLLQAPAPALRDVPAVCGRLLLPPGLRSLFSFPAPQGDLSRGWCPVGGGGGSPVFAARLPPASFLAGRVAAALRVRADAVPPRRRYRLSVRRLQHCSAVCFLSKVPSTRAQRRSPSRWKSRGSRGCGANRGEAWQSVPF